MEYFEYIFEVSKLNSLKQKFGFFLKATLLKINFKNKMERNGIGRVDFCSVFELISMSRIRVIFFVANIT